MEKLMRINSKSGLSRAAFVLSVVLPFLAMARVFAQAPPATANPGGQTGAAAAVAGEGAAAGTAEAERVIVTGSNIPTAEEVGPNPVTNLNRDYIQKTGNVNVEQLLKDQPINNSNSIPIANNGTSQGGPVGFSSVALRALDPGASLVLVDGRRVTRVLGGTFVDINTIPLAAVESIEILKSGASAVYGADAVAGVVNIHLWKDFRGAQLSVYYGNTIDGTDAAAFKADILFGVGDDKMSINGDIFYYHHNDTFNGDRGNSLTPPFLSSNASPWNLSVSQAVAGAAGAPVIGGSNPLEFVAPQSNTNGLAPASSYLAAAGRIRAPFALLPGFNFNEFSSSYPKQERWGGYAAFNDKICGDEVQIFGDFYYDDVKQHDELAPIATGSFVTQGSPTIAIPPHSDLNGVAPPNTPRYANQPASTAPGEVATGVDPNAFNPFNPFNQIISGGTRARIFDFGNRLIDTENEAWLSTVGVKGDKIFGSNWGYDTGFRYSQIYTIAQIQTASGTRFNRIMNANDPIFDPTSSEYIGTTIPYNPFTSFTQPTDQNNIPSILFARAKVRDLTKSSLAAIDGHAYTTDLFDMPAGPVGFAFGADWRREQFDFNPDDTDQNGDQIGVGQAKASFGGRKAYGIFAETQIPITSPKMGIPGLYSLEFNASGRFEEFLNNSTNDLVPRIGIRWQPFDEELTIRATWGEGFIEPSLASLYGAPIFILSVTDTSRFNQPGLGANNPFVTHGLNPAIPGGTEPETTQEVDANRNLQPEDSRNFSAGFVYTPKWIKNWQPNATLTFSIDFWDVERSGVVTTPSAQSLVTEFFKTPLGGLPPGINVGIDPATNTANFVQSGFENSGRQDARGIDLSLQYQFQTANWGTFTWSNDWTYLDQFLFQLNGASQTHNLVGRTNNDPFVGAFFGQVTIGDGFLRWKGISRITWDYQNFDLTVAGRYNDGFREQRNNHVDPDLLGGETVIEHWIKQRFFVDGQASYTLVFTQPVEQHPVAGYSKDNKQVKSGKDKEVVEQAAAMPCWKTLLNNTTYTLGCQNIFGTDPPKAFGFQQGNANNYPGGLYDNLGRFLYVEVIKKF
jgi:iron complex outermembrane recepter protein